MLKKSRNRVICSPNLALVANNCCEARNETLLPMIINSSLYFDRDSRTINLFAFWYD